MRTNVYINDDLLIELKRVAAERRQSLKELIEDAIRSSLANRKKPRNKKEIQHLVTFCGRGVQRGVKPTTMEESPGSVETMCRAGSGFIADAAAGSASGAAVAGDWRVSSPLATAPPCASPLA
jgi:hypothetical protein